MQLAREITEKFWKGKEASSSEPDKGPETRAPSAEEDEVDGPGTEEELPLRTKQEIVELTQKQFDEKHGRSVEATQGAAS